MNNGSPQSQNVELTGTIRVLIVDDHPMLRRGLRSLLECDDDLLVVGESASIQGALHQIEEKNPDLVLADLCLEDGSGLDLVAEISKRHMGIRTLVISVNEESVYAERAFKAGANGFIPKQEMGESILIAIRQILGGGTYMSPKMQMKFAEQFLGGRVADQGSSLENLTNRELEVFSLIGHGKSTRKIAEHLGRSIKTIESHREHIKQKLTLDSGDELKLASIRWVESGKAG